MATTTVTATTYTQPIKAVHAGVNTIFGSYTPATINTVGDTIKLAKIPDRALIVGGSYQMIDADAQLTVQIRDYSDSGSSTTSAGAKLCSGSAGQNTAFFIDGAAAITAQAQISLSDGVINKFVDVEALVTSATLSLAFSFRIDYVLDSEQS